MDELTNFSLVNKTWQRWHPLLVVFLQSFVLELPVSLHECSRLKTDVEGLFTQFETKSVSEGVLLSSAQQLEENLALRLQSGFLFRWMVKPLLPLTEIWHDGHCLPRVRVRMGSKSSERKRSEKSEGTVTVTWHFCLFVGCVMGRGKTRFMIFSAHMSLSRWKSIGSITTLQVW